MNKHKERLIRHYNCFINAIKMHLITYQFKNLNKVKLLCISLEQSKIHGNV